MALASFSNKVTTMDQGLVSITALETETTPFTLGQESATAGVNMTGSAFVLTMGTWSSLCARCKSHPVSFH